MKNLISLITLLIFLNTITNYMIVTEAKKEGLPVPLVDTDGNEIRAGIRYFFLPSLRGMGGGLVAGMMEGLCVYGVAQAKFDTDPGQLLTFFPEGFKVGDVDVVHESTDLNIGFSFSTGCRPSSIWKVGDYDESAKVNFIMLGGSVGNPGIETVSNWFKIEKHWSGHYKIVFCPRVCDFCAVTCSDIGIDFYQDGTRHLVLSEKPLLVQFQKFIFDHKQY